MKKMKKLLAFLLTFAMVMALGVAAMAASITINPADKSGTTGNTTYTAYKVFDAVKGDGGKVAYSVASDSSWVSVLKDSAQTWVTVDESANGTTYTITAKAGMNAEEFANYLFKNKPADIPVITFTKNSEGQYVTGTIDEGYYLVTSSLGTKLILDTTTTEVLQEKNTYPGNKKEAETGSVSIGEDVTYYITVDVPANVDTTKKIIVHDQMDSALKFNGDVTVYVADTPSTAWTLEEKKTFTYGTLTSDYVVATEGDTLKSGDTFTISIDTTNLTGKTVVFKYTAELTKAAIADNGYVNKEFINYSDYESTPNTPEVKTFDFDVNKVDSEGKDLTGAEFELRKTADSADTAIKFVTKYGGYKKADSTQLNDSNITKVTTLEAGKINIEGLGAGTYYLVETKAPAGYNKLQSAIKVEISDTGVITFTVGEGNTANTETADTIKVVNNAGTELPSTGGIGTTIFYVIGAILVLGAGVLLVTRRRMATK